MTELKRMEQKVKTMEKFVQDFRRVVRDNRYKERILVKEFKRVINKVIRRRLIEIEMSPTCYKTKVWTDFGQNQGQLDINR